MPTIEESTGRLTTRGDTLDDKIRKLEEQLMKHRDAIKKTRPGPAQDAAKRRALSVSMTCYQYQLPRIMIL